VRGNLNNQACANRQTPTPARNALATTLLQSKLKKRLKVGNSLGKTLEEDWADVFSKTSQFSIIVTQQFMSPSCIRTLTAVFGQR
jgi:hypothetical protein